MPTIDELQAVIVASDDDALPVSQGGTARRVSRAQLLAGTQTALALTPGLLGRSTSGLGQPEQVSIGNGLTLANGILSGTPQYSVAALQTANMARLTDLVPLAQSGQDRAISVRALLSTVGADISGQVAQSNVGNTRPLTDWLTDGVGVEAFGAVGDGVTDDSGAFDLAVNSGRPVILGPKVYRVDGQWTIQASTVLLGTPGVSVLRRAKQQGGAWINVSAHSFSAVGVTFDAGGVAGDSWGILLAPTCINSTFRQCSFSNATGKTLGTGLTIQARDGLTGHRSSHRVTDCIFQNNTCHGLWIQAACGAEIRGCQASSNGGYGINLDFNDAQFKQVVRQSTITECKCWNNLRGISVGNYNSTNTEPPRWGLENPDATDITISENVCSGNSLYGIAVSGTRILIVNNTVVIEDSAGVASGLLCNAGVSVIANNIVVGPGQFGIDAGGCADLSITANTVEGLAVGINAGGSKRVKIADNLLAANKRAITIFQVETDGQAQNFGIACSDILIKENDIQLEAGATGISLIDGPERVGVIGNRFRSLSSTAFSDLIWSHTDTATIARNSYNGLSEVGVSASISNSIAQLVIPEVFDVILIDTATTKVDAIIGQHQNEMIGRVSFVRVTDGGSGYTQASIVINGPGSGAVATAYIRDGVVIGAAVASSGVNYDTSSTTAVIVGDGQGATATPFVGVPAAQGRQLTFRCPSSIRFTQQASLRNWTNSDITIPAGGQIVWQAVSGQWQAAWFNNVDYVQPSGDGSVSIKSVSGDIRLRPASTGKVRFQSDLEPGGFLTSFGRGSPEGVVIAPPGSDYRNLNGGAGSTIWVKQTGLDSSGWFAVA